MSIYIGQMEFDGPGLMPGDLKDEPGIYVLLQRLDRSFELLDVGAAERLRSSWSLAKFDHLRESLPGDVSLAVCYTPQIGKENRSVIVKAIQNEYECATAARTACLTSVADAE